MMDLRKHTCAVEFDEIVVCRAFGWKIFRQLAPLAARGQHVQHAVDERAAADAALRRQEPLDESVLLVSQIARILETVALTENPVLDRPHARPANHAHGRTESQPIPVTQENSGRSLSSNLWVPIIPVVWVPIIPMVMVIVVIANQDTRSAAT